VTLFRTCSPDIRSSTQACRGEAAYHRQLGASKAAIPGLSGACRLPARQAVTGPQTSLLGEDLKCERDALAAADAQSHDAALETVAVHRVDEAGPRSPCRRSGEGCEGRGPSGAPGPSPSRHRADPGSRESQCCLTIDFGPAMARLTQRQRIFVDVCSAASSRLRRRVEPATASAGTLRTGPHDGGNLLRQNQDGLDERPEERACVGHRSLRVLHAEPLLHITGRSRCAHSDAKGNPRRDSAGAEARAVAAASALRAAAQAAFAPRAAKKMRPRTSPRPD
jgi:hypothetical protein